MGTTHHYEYFANNKPIGSYQVAAYNPDAYPLPGAACGALAREHRYVIKIYPGMDTRYWTCANPGIDTVRGAPVMVWKEGQTIASDINLLRRRLQIASDNLLYRKLIPPMVHLLIAPGEGPESKGTRRRSIHYNTEDPQSAGRFRHYLRVPCRLAFPGPTQPRAFAYRSMSRCSGSRSSTRSGIVPFRVRHAYDFHFRLGTNVPVTAQGAMDLPESLAWLWRGYDAARSGETFEMEPEEKAKHLFRVRVSSREAW